MPCTNCSAETARSVRDFCVESERRFPRCGSFPSFEHVWITAHGNTWWDSGRCKISFPTNTDHPSVVSGEVNSRCAADICFTFAVFFNRCYTDINASSRFIDVYPHQHNSDYRRTNSKCYCRWHVGRRYAKWFLLVNFTVNRRVLAMGVVIGIILGGTGRSWPPPFWSGRTDPPLYKYTKFCLIPFTFQTKVMPLGVVGWCRVLYSFDGSWSGSGHWRINIVISVASLLWRVCYWMKKRWCQWNVFLCWGQWFVFSTMLCLIFLDDGKGVQRLKNSKTFFCSKVLLRNYHPSVLLHCWFGHLNCKIVSEMTYSVSSGTLNPTIPIPIRNRWRKETKKKLPIKVRLV